MECVQGSVTMPTTFTSPSGESGSTANYLFIWVGIGGVTGNRSIWQAGIWIEQNVGEQYVLNWRPVYDGYNAVNKSGSIYFIDTTPNDTMPRSMTAQVCTEASGFDIYSLTFYSSSGGKEVLTGTVGYRFFPNEASAEWIVESPYSGGFYGIPDFSPANWTNPNWTDQFGTYTIFLDALGSWAIADTNCNCGYTQYVNPSRLTLSDTQFSETYSP